MQVIEQNHTGRQSTFLVRCADPVLDPAWTVTPVSLDDLVIAYMGAEHDPAPAPPAPPPGFPAPPPGLKAVS
jgi:ABC-2 type transport system ATP-binding protein